MLQNNPTLKSKIDQLWNKFWAGGISNPLTAIEQITYLLFMKRLDELDSKEESDAEFTGEKFTSRFSGTWNVPNQGPVDKKELRWSFFKRMKAEEMLTHVQTKVFPYLKDLNGEESNFTHHMRNAVFIIPKPSLLVEAVKTIDEIFEEMERDTSEGGQTFQDIQGDVYEYLLSEIATAGKNGQFRTPRHIIKLIADLVQPKLGDYIADPACGTGGFLLGIYQYIITQIAKQNNGELITDEDGFERCSVSAGLTENVKEILGKSLFGFDIDSTMVRLGLMNLMMHGIDEPQIDYKDTLSKSFNEEGKYQIIVANPPFTGNIDKGDINENLSLSTTKTELLFLENIYRMLKKGGTAGVIIPQGVLFGGGKAFVECRKILVDKCELKAVISLPSGVFKPYAGVATAILLFTKVYGKEDKVDIPATSHTWFYDVKYDGYTLDDKRSKVDKSDLQKVVAKYKKRNPQKETDRSSLEPFFVPYKEIKEEKYDLSFSKYFQPPYNETVYEKPEILIKELIESEIGEMDPKTLGEVEGGILKELLELKDMIG